MAKFRKKSMVVEAEQFNPANVQLQRGVCGCDLTYGVGPHLAAPDYGPHATVYPLYDGDWIVEEPDGAFCRVRAADFDATYEPVTHLAVTVTFPSMVDPLSQINDCIGELRRGIGRLKADGCATEPFTDWMLGSVSRLESQVRRAIKAAAAHARPVAVWRIDE